MSTKPAPTIRFPYNFIYQIQKFWIVHEVSKNSILRLLFSIFYMGCPGLEPGTSRME